MRRWLNIAAVLLIAALAIGLYKAKTDAARAQAHVRDLQTSIEETEADLRALRAEIAHLERPERIEALAEEHLGAVVGSESTALPEDEIGARLPAPRAKGGE